MNFIDYKQLFILLILFNGLLCQMAARQCGVASAAEFDAGQPAGCFCKTATGPKCIMQSDDGKPLIKLIGNEVGLFGNAACSNVDGSTFVKKSGVPMAACQQVIGFCRPLEPDESNVDQVCCGGFSCNSCTQSYTQCSTCAGSHKLVSGGICEYDGSPTPNPPSNTPAPPITTTPKPTPVPTTITPTSKSNNPASPPQPSNGTPTPAPPTTKPTTASTNNNNSQPPTPSSVSPTNADVSCLWILLFLFKPLNFILLSSFRFCKNRVCVVRVNVIFGQEMRLVWRYMCRIWFVNCRLSSGKRRRLCSHECYEHGCHGNDRCITTTTWQYR